jgi:dipeptidyl aminopeptidase/acylaminoacyl peptidase
LTAGKPFTWFVRKSVPVRKVFSLLGLLALVFLPAASSPAQVERREVRNLVLEDIPDMSREIVERMRQYTNYRSARFTGWDPGGQGLYVATGSQIHYVERPGGSREQLTFFNEPVREAAVRPAGQPAGFLFLKDVGGSEFYQIFYFDVATGEHGVLTDGQDWKGGHVWSQGGDRFVYYSTARNGRDWDIYVADVEDPGAARMVLEAEGVYYPMEWSPDDSRLLVRQQVSWTESYLYVVDLSGGQVTQLNPSDDKIAYGRDAAWSRDGLGVYYTSDESSEFQRLRYSDLATGQSTVLTGDVPWDVEALEVSHKGEVIAFITNEDGIDRLHVRMIAGGRRVPVPELPVGLIRDLKFSPDDRQLGLTLNTPRTPSDVYTLDIGGRILTRWTYGQAGDVETERFAVPELIHYPTFDEVGGRPRMIPALYYRSAAVEPPHPVIVSIHGSEDQARPSFSSTYQYWINELGVALLEPNVRGSTGYGKTYVQLDDGVNRERSVRDIGALLDWIEDQPELDEDRVAVYGHSYGGYMVLAAMTHYNDRLKAGVEMAGISNFVTFLENTEEYRRDSRRTEYGDERDPEMRDFLISISPVTNANKITKPMFVAQGLSDPRVPASESEQIVATVRENGGQVWYMLAKDEGHYFQKEFNSGFYRQAVVQFWEHFLLR